MTEKEFLEDFRSREQWEQFYWFKYYPDLWRPIRAIRQLYQSENDFFEGAIFEINPGAILVPFEGLKGYGELGDCIEKPEQIKNPGFAGA